jgi:undecaprenyl-diphosphatase
LEAVILGVIQGLAEFLPISSSGHLVLFQKIFGLEEGAMTFDVVLHVGTLIAVIVIYWETIFELIKKPFQKLTYLLIVATIPTVAAALLFGDAVDALFESGRYLAYGFLFTGIILIISDKLKSEKKSIKDISYIDALAVGAAQCAALPPGISRSGATITGARAVGINRGDAARFSFLMSIPAILGSAVLTVVKIARGDANLEALPLLPTLFGFVAAVLSGYLSINFMIKLIKEAKLKYFAYYVFLLAALILIDQNFTHLFF